jgi:predicted RNA-binding protein associated with RNAse of E/G family
VTSAAPGQAVTVRKLDWRGNFVYSWRGTLIERSAEHLLIEAPWEGPGEPLFGEIRVARGDRFMEYYYPGRGYAVWQIENADGAVKLWYCNVESPVREDGGTLEFSDLLLDVVAYPDGRHAILDRDELEAARREGLSDADARFAEQALSEVLAQIRDGAPPFVFDSSPRLVGQD